jgi:hypothetical protein
MPDKITRYGVRHTKAVSVSAVLDFPNDDPAGRDKFSTGVVIWAEAGGGNVYVGIGSAPTATAAEYTVEAGKEKVIDVPHGTDVYVLASTGTVDIAYRQFYRQ